ncbi:MAG: acetate kinase [Candidatus Muiribacterium halophilum]|uniref:Acetate kinase n=1 Tax=Muiribacterium halophilum TaxID=2053465 RepID=A0A2N5Z9N8_MUIH1|nr:MAG: acetate kinase [Candidatus Muirbacterium halophilum]
MPILRTATILVINCGSSSLKYEIIKMPEQQSLGKGLVERIGTEGSIITQKTKGMKHCENFDCPDHKEAMKKMCELLINEEFGIISDLSLINAVGHRVVHGGEKYSESVIIDKDVIKAIEENVELAPLHNPANLIGINEAKEIFPMLRQVAVFDTSFHQTLPPSAYLYGLPIELYEKHRIRRYGFHGTSHRYVSNKALDMMRRFKENTNVISCHLGNGASITAIEHGKSIDTSMGFTPLEGLMMGTRSGDIDPAIIFYLSERGFSNDEINHMLNKKSGLLGLSGISNDLRDLEEKAANGNEKAKQALDVYAYKIRKYIGSYAANLVKVDILVFTGGIGENGIKMRERICHRLESIGIFMDYDKNSEVGANPGIISQPYSPVAILVIPTNEELQIALDTYDLYV